jgi:hypothetical protein
VVADGRRDEVLRALAQQQGGAPAKPAGPAEPAGPAANDAPRTAAAGGSAASFVADRLKGSL